MSIELITRENGTRAIEFTNQSQQSQYAPALNETIETDEIDSFGELIGGHAILEHHTRTREGSHTIPMTPAIHADIKQHIKIPETKRTAGEPYTPPRVIDLERLDADLNNLGLIVAGLVTASNPIPYPTWRLKTSEKGVSHLVGVEGEDEMVCAIPTLGATFCQVPRDVTPEHDGKRKLTVIAANGDMHVFNTENSGEFGQIMAASLRGEVAIGTEAWPDILPNRD